MDYDMNPSAPSSQPGSAQTASSATSWFSGIVRGRSSSGKMPNNASISAVDNSVGGSSGPINKKHQFRGMMFKYGPKSIQVAFKTGDYKQQVIFIGGLTDGFLATEYLEPLAIALEKERWSLVQFLLSSSYSGYGTSSLKQDAVELDQLISYLINKEDSEGVVLLGHSTGCQDIVHYLQTNAACSRAVRAAILQAPVSDREHRATLPETASMIDLASNLLSENRSSELMPREANSDSPITAYRYHSLCAYNGDDDMFSSDFSEDQLKQKLGHMSNTPTLVMFSMADENVPDYVNKKALVDRQELVNKNKSLNGSCQHLSGIHLTCGSMHFITSCVQIVQGNGRCREGRNRARQPLVVEPNRGSCPSHNGFHPKGRAQGMGGSLELNPFHFDLTFFSFFSCHNSCHLLFIYFKIL